MDAQISDRVLYIQMEQPIRENWPFSELNNGEISQARDKIKKTKNHKPESVEL